MGRKYFFKDFIYFLKYRVFRSGSYNDDRSYRGFIFFVLFIGLTIWSFSVFEARIKPTVISLCEAKAKAIAVRTIDNAINEEVVKKISYEDLVTVRKDSNDRISAIQMNIVKMNEIQSRTSLLIQENLSDIDDSDLYIPLGNLFNSTILAGWGPKVKIKIMPVGTVQTEYSDNFITAGINQTKHRIVLDVKGKITVVVPLVSMSTEIVTSVPIAETIIVGNVPGTYIDVSGATGEELQKARVIAPNLTNKQN